MGKFHQILALEGNRLYQVTKHSILLMINCDLQRKHGGWVWWLTLVISVTHKAEIMRIEV
jgi:hypothetical protein